MWFRIISVAAATFFLLGCANMQLKQMQKKALAEIDIEACVAGGGEVRGVCMFGIPACVQIYRNGGEPCRDSSECEGLCSVRMWEGDAPSKGETWVGECEIDNDRCGCWFEVKNGRAEQAICQD